MDGHKVRLRCLELARGMADTPASLLRASFVFESYVACGFHVGMDTLRQQYGMPPEEPAPAAEDDDAPGGALPLH